MSPEMEQIVMQIIVSSGDCRSDAMEAIYLAKQGDIEGAYAKIKSSETSILDAHHIQTDLIQKEAGGQPVELSLLMVHAQDHLMTSILVKDLAKEIVALWEAKK